MQTFPSLMATVRALVVVSFVAAVPARGQPPIPMAVEAERAARKVMMNDPAAALAIGIDLERHAARVADQRQRQIAVAKAKWIAGEANLRLNHVDEARRLIEASYALSVASGDLQSQGDSLLSRGSIKSHGGDPAGGLQDFLTAYQLFQHPADARSRSITLQYMSQLYADARDYTRAESYLRQAAQTYDGEPMLQLALANNMANLLSEQGQFTSAEKELNYALSIARNLKAHALESQLLGNLALVQIKQGRLKEASHTVQEITNVSRRTGVKISAQSRATMARLAFAQSRIRLARTIMDEILAPVGSKRPVFDQDLHTSAYEIYKAAGDTRLALAHLEIASRLRNEAVALGISNKAALMAARFDFETQDLRIAALNAKVFQRDIALRHEATIRERTIFAASGLLVLVVMALLGAWLAVLRRSRDRLRTVSARLEESNLALQSAFEEVHERAQAERSATRLALHDPLTGLPNRRQLSEDFQASLQNRSDTDSDIFVLVLDLDCFKPVNDIHGHEVGDKVLVATAGRLRSLCNRIKAKAVRLGGDEFVVVVSSARDNDAVEQLAKEIIQELRAPIYIAERRLTLGASIGIAHYPQDGGTIDELLRAADIAMYEAKRSGQNTWRFFEPAMKARHRLRQFSGRNAEEW